MQRIAPGPEEPLISFRATDILWWPCTAATEEDGIGPAALKNHRRVKFDRVDLGVTEIILIKDHARLLPE